MSDLIVQLRPFILILHLFSVIVGFGAALTADMLFFRFLKDLRISQFESKVLKYVSQLIWIGITLIFLSGFILFLSDAQAFLSSPKFLAKMVVFAVIVINGLVLHFSIHPTLTKICFGKRHKHHDGELHKERERAFISGAISMTSWLSAFLLGAIPASQPFSFIALLAIYALLLSIAITVAYSLQRYLKVS